MSGSSLFTSIFPYRQREGHSPLENFITEIFAFCLRNDNLLRTDFFKLLDGINFKAQQCDISTQSMYETYGRPDMEIEFEDTIILFECKIEAGERINQLNDYASLVRKVKDHHNKHIVYLTKYYEHKELSANDVHLHLIRWCDVYKIIGEHNNLITQQFKQFLKENNMESVKNFTIQDLLAMKSISGTISKMDELLEQFKPEFQKMFDGFSKDSSRSSRLRNNLYINFVTLNHSKAEYWLLIGFFWNWEGDVEIPHVGISIEMPMKKLINSKLINTLDEELGNNNDWEYEQYPDTDLCYYSALKPITDFISQPQDNIPAMKKYISNNLKTIYGIKEKYPDLFKKE